MPTAQDPVENSQQQPAYPNTVRDSPDPAQMTRTAEPTVMDQPASHGRRSDQGHHGQYDRRHDKDRREGKTRSGGSHGSLGQDDRVRKRGSDHLPAPVVHPKAPSVTSVVPANATSESNKHDSSVRSPPGVESQRSDPPSPSDEDFDHVECDDSSARAQARPRAISPTNHSTGVSSASQAARHRSSNDSGSRRSYATVVRPENPPASATAAGSLHNEYTAPLPTPPNPQANETPIYAQNATVPAQEEQLYSPPNTFQETSPHPMPGDMKPDAADSTHRRQQQSQQGDAHRSTPATSGGIFTSGIRSLISGSIGHIVEDEMNRMKEKLRVTKAELEHCRDTLDSYKYELQRSQGEVRALARSCHELKHDRQRLADANQGLVHELNAVTRRLEDTKALSDTRGKELIGAQAFLTKADSLSVSDVVQKVEALNEEIFQASASLGETIARKKYDLTDEQLGQCLEGVSRLIGEPLANIVMREAQKPEEEPVNPLLVQVVLQVFMANFCVDKIRAWTPNDATINTFLKGIYTYIRDNEEQAVSGRWRALTRKNLVADPAPWTPQLAQQLSFVFQLSGWDASNNHRESFENQLVPIFKGVQEARSALGEMFTSADLEAATVLPGVPFKKEYMEEVYGDGEHRKNGEEIVVATTGIGIRKGLPRERRYEAVMPAKVILESSLKVALEPQPQRTSRKGKREKRSRDEEHDGQGKILGFIG